MEETENVKKRRLPASWSQKEIDIIEFASKDKLDVSKIYEAVKELLPGKEEHSIRSKIYSATRVLRNSGRLNAEIALKEKRELKAAKKNGISNPLSTTSLIPKQEQVEDYSEESTAEAVKERIDGIKEDLFCEKIIAESTTEESVVEDDDVNILRYQNKTISVSKGTIKVPFAGDIECDFEITGTFSIRKIGKKTLI